MAKGFRAITHLLGKNRQLLIFEGFVSSESSWEMSKKHMNTLVIPSIPPKTSITYYPPFLTTESEVPKTRKNEEKWLEMQFSYSWKKGR